MSIILKDLFNDALGTDIVSRESEIGGQPSEHPNFTTGQALVVSGQVYSAGTNSTVIIWPNYVTDVVIDTTFDVKAVISNNNYFAITPRTGPTATTWTTASASIYTGGIKYGPFVYDTGSGGYLLAASPSGTAPFVGEHKLTMSASGQLYRAWLDNREFFRMRNDSYASGKIGIIFGAPATTTTGFHLKDIIAQTTYTRNQIQYVGDSMTQAATTASGGSNYIIDLDKQWTYILSNRLIASGIEHDWANLGVGGRQIDAMITSAQQMTFRNAILTSTTPHADNGHGCDLARRPDVNKDIIVFQGGINDLANSVSAEDVKTRISTFVSGRLALGFQVVVETIPYCDEASTYIPAGFNANVDIVNTHIRQNSFGATAIFDVHDYPELGEYDDPIYKNIYDGTHWTESGTVFKANAMFSTMYNVLTATDSQLESVSKINEDNPAYLSNSVVYYSDTTLSKRRDKSVVVDLDTINTTLSRRLRGKNFYWNGNDN